jgi:hypothetical protein
MDSLDITVTMISIVRHRATMRHQTLRHKEAFKKLERLGDVM